MTAARDVIGALRAAGLSVATAESLTGGLVCASLVEVPGASQVVRGGVVAYAADLKRDLLGVEASHLATYGTVHAGTAERMARGVRTRCSSDLGVATTGVAGPDPSEGKPAGTVFVSVADAAGVVTRRLALPGDRQEIRSASVAQALELVLERVRGAGKES